MTGGVAFKIVTDDSPSHRCDMLFDDRGEFMSMMVWFQGPGGVVLAAMVAASASAQQNTEREPVPNPYLTVSTDGDGNIWGGSAGDRTVWKSVRN